MCVEVVEGVGVILFHATVRRSFVLLVLVFHRWLLVVVLVVVVVRLKCARLSDRQREGI